MAVYKDETSGTWRVIYRYTDFTGAKKQTSKRGFATKREALNWEHETKLRTQAKLDMTFESFWQLYKNEKQRRVKESTWAVIKASRPSPMTAALSDGSIWTCLVISSAAASGSVKIACSGARPSGTI